MSDGFKDIRDASQKTDAPLREMLSQMRQALHWLRDNTPTIRALQGAGLADERGRLLPIDLSQIAVGAQGPAGEQGPPGAGVEPPDLTQPPTPTGLTAVGALASVIAQWGNPSYTAGHGHKQTNIYATKQPAADATLYTIADAVRVSAAPGAQTIASVASDPDVKWRIWIKWESNDGVESDPAGGVNGVVVTTGQDVSALLSVLSGELTAAQLASSLATPIALIPSKTQTFRQAAVPTAVATGDLWIDTGSTNLFLWSDDMVQWAASASAGCTIVADAVAGPDGVINADKIREGTANQAHLFDRNQALDATGAYTLATSAKSAERSVLILGLQCGGQSMIRWRFNLATGVASALDAGGSGGMVSEGGGWYRCWLTAAMGSTVSPIQRIQIEDNDSGPTIYTGNGASGLYVAARQLEAGSTRGRYIPTTSASVSTIGNNQTLRWSGAAWVLSDDARIGATAAAVVTETANRISGDAANASLITTVQSSLANAAGNRVKNSSFELDVNGNGFADGVGEYNNGAISTSVSLVAGRTGGLAQRVNFTGTANTNTQGINIQSSNMNPDWVTGKTYVISFYAKGSGGQIGRTMVLGWNTHPATSTTLLNPPLSSEWQRYAFRITWGASVETGGQIYLTSATGSPARNGILDFDDLMVQEGDTLTAYTPGLDGGGALTASVQTEAATRASQDGLLFAKYGVKLDVNGYTIGWAANNDGVQGTIVFRTDTFIVGGTGYSPVQPFIIRTSGGTEGGVSYPAGVYMDSAYITNLTAMWARFGTLVADSVQATEISASRLTVGTGAIGGNLRSTTYTGGSIGWIVRPDGYAEFNNVVVRGTVYASAGAIGGSFIGSTYIQSTTWVSGSNGWRFNSDGTGWVGGIYMDTTSIRSSNYILNSQGFALRADGTGQIGGLKVNATNIESSNYVAGTSGMRINYNGDVEIDNLTARGDITANHLDAASGTFSGTMTAAAVEAVDSINLKGNSVVIPVGVEWSGSVSNNTTWVTGTGSFDAKGGGVIVSGSVRVSGSVVGGSSGRAVLRIYRDGSLLRSAYGKRISPGSSEEADLAYVFMDTPTSGGHTYQIGGSVENQNNRIIAASLACVAAIKLGV